MLAHHPIAILFRRIQDIALYEFRQLCQPIAEDGFSFLALRWAWLGGGVRKHFGSDYVLNGQQRHRVFTSQPSHGHPALKGASYGLVPVDERLNPVD